MEHEEYMRQALELARLAMAEGEVPVGCVIVRDGAVVGRGRNRRETAQTALGHAELEAIAQASRHPRIYGRVLEAECAALLQEFFQSLR